ncbi:hypothetical protein PMIT1318_00078 [Prochlorococcus marinus str. MIT 1318]|nr:hypothetical protein PMIT1318_00078 [Prochlorococcus marinus str. MIT 1318]
MPSLGLPVDQAEAIIVINILLLDDLIGNRLVAIWIQLNFS